MPRTRKLTHGKHRRDVVHHLPKRGYQRRASHTPDGRRRATLHNLGEVTIVLAKKRRNHGPKGVKILVTNLTEASAGQSSARTHGVDIIDIANGCAKRT